MALVVNLFAGPGAGKSTTAAGVFHELKKLGVSCELVTEFAKDKVWEGNKKVFCCQPYILGKQFWRLFRCDGEVDVVITDSPLLLTVVYNDRYSDLQHLNPFVFELFNKFNNLNYVIQRTKTYDTRGRNEDVLSAQAIDGEVAKLLFDNEVPFRKLDYGTAVGVIVDEVKSLLSCHP